MTDNKELRDKIIEHLTVRIKAGHLSNKDQVHIIEAICQFFNLATLSDYSKREGISYNGVKDRIKSGKVEVINFFNVDFIIDNI